MVLFKMSLVSSSDAAGDPASAVSMRGENDQLTKL